MPNFKNVNFSVIERIIIKKYNINKSERNTPKYDLLILYIMTFKILQIFDLKKNLKKKNPISNRWFLVSFSSKPAKDVKKSKSIKTCFSWLPQLGSNQ